MNVNGMLPLIVALDYPNQEQALAMAERLDHRQCRVKVGKELFTAAGPSVVEALQHRGFQVFLDLKFHDIPNTVAAAVRVAADLGVWMVNVHASGGRRMLEAARDSLQHYSQPPLLIGVTVLTSMESSDLREVGCHRDVGEQVLLLADLCSRAGLDGVVCSAQEAAQLRQRFGTGFQLVTPGIRLPGDDAGDQRRVLTPSDALAAGVSYLVVGRSITGAQDPLAKLALFRATVGTN